MRCLRGSPIRAAFRPQQFGNRALVRIDCRALVLESPHHCRAEHLAQRPHVVAVVTVVAEEVLFVSQLPIACDQQRVNHLRSRGAWVFVREIRGEPRERFGVETHFARRSNCPAVANARTVALVAERFRVRCRYARPALLRQACAIRQPSRPDRKPH